MIRNIVKIFYLLLAPLILLPSILIANTVNAEADNLTLNLKAGWNLISLPFNIDGESRNPEIIFASLLASDNPNLNIIWSYEACSNTWQAWIPGLGDTLQIYDGKGYWLNLDYSATLSINGTFSAIDPINPPPQYSVCVDWNLIGFTNGTESELIDDYLGGTNFTYAWTFDNGTWYFINSGDLLKPGQGYWVNFNQPDTVEPGILNTGPVLTCDSFFPQNNLTQTLLVSQNNSFNVTLGNNSDSTGYVWSEEANIDNPDLIQQLSHVQQSPEQLDGTTGGCGCDVWEFKALEKGICLIYFDYSQPWDGGDKSAWTYTLTVYIE